MNKKKAKAGSWKPFFYLLFHMDMPWLWILIAFIISMSYSEILLKVPATTASLMSGNLNKSALTSAVIYYVAYAVVLFINFGVTGLVQNIAIKKARNRAWQKMTRVKIQYYDNNSPSEMASAITNDLENSVPLLITALTSIIPDVYFVILALAKVSSYNIALMLSIAAILPLRYLYMVGIGRWNYKMQANIYGRIGTLTGYLSERIHNLLLIKYYTNEEEELKHGEIVSDDLFNANLYATKVECISSAVSSAIIILQYVAMIFTGVILLQNGKISMAQWVGFFLYAEMLISKFSNLISDWQSIKSAQGTISRVVDLMDAPEENIGDNILNKETKADKCMDIRFEEVSFSYGEKQALKQVSFSIPEGSKTAIVGLCGSGKTTIISLLERFYDISEGKIYVGNISIDKENLPTLREQFSYVQQDAEIFGGSIREILTYGLKRKISDDELIAALKEADAYSFVQDMNGSLDAIIAPDGKSISGGQKQKLSLAREFLKDKEILLLDEPTSALDKLAAISVKEAIFRLFQHKTIIMVTHDLSLLSGMDQIIVMNNGAVEASGTFQTLMDSCKLFQEMVEVQTLGEEATAK